MPKFPRIPQLSIVVPVTADLGAFERTLISVLENRPSHSEVVVTHDGSYQDPYALDDEVRFVTSPQRSFGALVSAGCDAARGRLVHVLAEGIQATEGWTDDAIHRFEEYECGSVTPMIRQASTGHLVAAGWTDSMTRLVAPRTDLRQKGRRGCYLQASFWRRDLIRSLGKSFNSDCVDQSSDVYQRLSRQAGWNCDLATDSVVLCDSESLPWDRPSFSRGMRLRAVAKQFGSSGPSTWLAAAASVMSPGQMIEALGGLAAPMAASNLAASLDVSQVVRCEDEGVIMKMPVRESHHAMRRAA